MVDERAIRALTKMGRAGCLSKQRILETLTRKPCPVSLARITEIVDEVYATSDAESNRLDSVSIINSLLPVLPQLGEDRALSIVFETLGASDEPGSN